LSGLKKRAPDWPTVSIGFHRNQDVVIDGLRWRVNYKIHALCDHPRGPYKPWLRSSITVWPPSPRNGQLDRRSRAQQRQWCDRIGRELLRQGYSGEWLRFSWGRFGDYWRRLSDSGALITELKRLDRMELHASESSVALGELAQRTRKTRSPRLVQSDLFFELWASSSALKNRWRTSSFSLQQLKSQAIHGARLHTYYGIHVLAERKARLGSFIYLWPSLRSVRNRGGWHPRLLERGWYQACSDHLVSIGYVGEWRLWDVRHGMFRKKLKNPKAAMVEVARLRHLKLVTS
jgi:hypothetical protein